MIIENAKTSDWRILYQIAKETNVLDIHTPYTYYLMCMMYSDQIFLLKHDEEVFGYIMSIKNDNYVFIWQIAVRPIYQGNGYSKYLYDAVFKFAKKHEYEIILLSISPKNKISINALNAYCTEHKLKYNVYNEGIRLELQNFNELEDIYIIGI